MEPNPLDRRQDDKRILAIEKAVAEIQKMVKEIKTAQDAMGEELTPIMLMINEIRDGAFIMCRIAKANQFIFRKIILPNYKWATMVGLMIYYVIHNDFPDWAKLLIKVVIG